jgi:hypothetical protein
VKIALKIATGAGKSRLSPPSNNRRATLRLVAPVNAPRQSSTAFRSAKSGGHERVLRALDRLALFGIVIAVALMPVLAAGHAAKKPAPVETAVASNDENLGFFQGLIALGYAIWRPTPVPSRPVQNPSRQDRSAPAPRHFPSTN